jgi:hypothetical protein
MIAAIVVSKTILPVQHQVQNADDGAVDVAVDVLQESDEIHRVDF